MAGIYIHIPFCKRKCHYCNFFSIVSVKYQAPLLDALKGEIFMQRKYLSGKKIDTIYFGGGTPSMLDPAEIKNILAEIKKHHPVSENAEITIEVNPDDINQATSPNGTFLKERADKAGLLQEYRNLGINRISIGVQSFFDDDLEYLNRIHSAARAVEAIRSAQNAGFNNISIDLIYGIPTLTEDKWHQNLETAFSLDIQHISAYSLTVEPQTALDVLIRKKKMQAPLEENAIAHFRSLMTEMKKNSFLHYEISNFCKEGYFSRHNCMYWNRDHYLGLGPSAHSFNGVSRQWNVASVIEYIDQVRNNERFFESEMLTFSQRYNEYIMTSLRTMWGCDGNRIKENFGEAAASGFRLLASGYIKKGLMAEKEGVYYLTDEGKLFADGIASDLFIES